MAERIYIGSKPSIKDALGEKIKAKIISDLKIQNIDSIRTAFVYILNDAFSYSELTELAKGPFSDPVIQTYSINKTIFDDFDWMVEIGFRPGVTDNVGRTAKEAVTITLKKDFSENFSVHTAIQYFFYGKISKSEISKIAQEILANSLIQTIKIFSKEEWLKEHTKDFGAPVVLDSHTAPLYVEINLNIDDKGLCEISRKGMLALSCEEMKCIKEYFSNPQIVSLRKSKGLPSNITNVELEILAQTWSEHCKHKIFNAYITYKEDEKEENINSLFKSYIKKATEIVRKNKKDKDYCLSVFKDNAGVIRFNNDYAIAFKVETHNSPSALDPYGGALTGIVGVNRDPFGTGLGCRLIANTDVFCFASPFYNKPLPPRILHPKRVLEGVREGVEHGGNKSGIPTVNGTIVFDERFLGKPLVYCGTIGIMPLNINGRKGWEKKACVGDHIIMVGGRIGKDGIHGATFSSEPLHEGSPATAVQIGDPITQKRMTDFLLKARDLGLYNSITDNGAGGLSSSIGEMAQDTGGAIVNLEKAPLKYHGLEPWEIFLSEAQERMTVAVSEEKLQEFLLLAKEWNVEATDLGEFTNTGFLEVRYNENVIAFLSMDFLHNGLPQMKLNAKWEEKSISQNIFYPQSDIKSDILDLLKSLNICSKEYVVRQYDHEVQAGSIIKPLCGAECDGPSDAAVIMPVLGCFEGIAISNGILPRYSDIDTYSMACCAFDEAIRNAVCVGGDPNYMAALDNFCWCDPIKSQTNPDGEYKLAQLVRANKALFDICTAYGIPLISGKDSMKNDYNIGNIKISIPPTLLISIVAKVPDIRKCVTMDFKEDGNFIYLIGVTYPELGASEYAILKNVADNRVPNVHNFVQTFSCYCALFSAIQENLVKSCHDISDGGFAVAISEMCFSGELGADVDLKNIHQKDCKSDIDLLFSETPGRIIVEVSPKNAHRFESFFNKLPLRKIGTTTKNKILKITDLNNNILEISVQQLKEAWKSTLRF